MEKRGILAVLAGVTVLASGCSSGPHSYSGLIDPCKLFVTSSAVAAAPDMAQGAIRPVDGRGNGGASQIAGCGDSFENDRHAVRTIRLTVELYEGDEAVSRAAGFFTGKKGPSGPWDHATVVDGYASGQVGNVVLSVDIEDTGVETHMPQPSAAVMDRLLADSVDRLKTRYDG